jgi:hypothetical protein
MTVQKNFMSHLGRHPSTLKVAERSSNNHVPYYTAPYKKDIHMAQDRDSVAPVNTTAFGQSPIRWIPGVQSGRELKLSAQRGRWNLAVRRNLVKSVSDKTRLEELAVMQSLPLLTTHFHALPKTAWSYTSNLPYVFMV